MTIWKPKLEKYPGPRYKALAEALADDIAKGRLTEGQQLPTHRALAEDLGVTVGTITRGFAEAERRNLITARVGSGTFVANGRGGNQEFKIHEQNGDQVIDFSLAFAPFVTEEIELQQTLRELAENPILLRNLLSYYPETGMIRHREAIVQWLAENGIEAAPDHIVICNGGQNGIGITLQALAKPGDRILAEGLTYPGFINVARQQAMRITGIPMDDNGILPDQLDTICRQYNPGILYCTPTLHNPTSITFTEERRHEIIEIAEKRDLLILEDAVPACLQSDQPPALVSLAPEKVIHIGSFSKTFAGGLRVGYILGPPPLLQKIRTAFRADCWMAPPLMVEITSQWIENGTGQNLLSSKRQELRERQEIVDDVFTGLNYQNQIDSLYAWLWLPEPWSADDFALQVEKNGVLVKPSATFTAGRYPAPHGIRICISSPQTRDEVKTGLEIIRATLDEKPDIWQSVI